MHLVTVSRISGQLRKVMEDRDMTIHDNFDLKELISKNITSGDTLATIDLFCKYNDKKTYLVGTGGYYAMIGTRVAQGKPFFLAQHQHDFHHKKISSITVYTQHMVYKVDPTSTIQTSGRTNGD